MSTRKTIFVFIMLLISLSSSKAQFTTGKYKFDIEKELNATSVKNQQSSGTCWCFATVSFLESELLREGKNEYDLSEMYIVRQNFHLRAIDYVRFHGIKGFSDGAEGWDVFNVIKKYGLVPQEAYSGLNYGSSSYKHGELVEVLKSYLDAVVKNENKKLSTAWLAGFDAILDAYLGKVPEKFTYKNKEYTPMSFSKELGINIDNYISVGSYTHHDYYKQHIFEGPDNWSMGSIYNVPLDEMITICDNSIQTGYTFAWGSDVSEKSFSHSNGLAIVPEFDLNDMSNGERAKWEQLPSTEQAKIKSALFTPATEKLITPEIRQLAFDNYTTTEDHLMHITGIAKEANGTKFYKVKNSWGEDNVFKGYFFTSEAFVRYKTVNIIVNKNAVPKAIAKKMGL